MLCLLLLEVTGDFCPVLFLFFFLGNLFQCLTLNVGCYHLLSRRVIGFGSEPQGIPGGGRFLFGEALEELC